MTLVRFDHVSLDFGAHRLLREAEFSIEPGERVCLIGRNGAGKTSMLKLITGQFDPDAGRVIRQSDLCIGQLDQALPVEMNLTVGEFVSAGLEQIERLCTEYQRRSQLDLDAGGLRELEALHALIETHGGWNPEQRVAAVCSEMELPVEDRLKELSGGWCRRVALARALVSHPDLLLLDEPFAALDEILREQLNQLVHEIWRQRRLTTLFVTHNVTEAVYLGGRVIVMNSSGQLVNDRTIDLPNERVPSLKTTSAFINQVVDVSECLQKVLL